MNLTTDQILVIVTVAISSFVSIWLFYIQRKKSKEDNDSDYIAKIPAIEKNQQLLFKYKDEHDDRLDDLESVKSGEKIERITDKMDKFSSGHIQLASKVEEGFRHTEKRLDKLEDKE